MSHQLSNQSMLSKTQIELVGRAFGLFKQSVAIPFLGDICNVALHHIDGKNFRICLVSLNKENGGLNQIVLDLVFDEQSFNFLFEVKNSKDFNQGENQPLYSERKQKDDEINLQSVEVLEAKFFFDYIEPGVRAYEELLCQEFGGDISFDFVVLD